MKQKHDVLPAVLPGCRTTLAQLLHVDPHQLDHTFLRFERVGRFMQRNEVAAGAGTQQPTGAGDKIAVFITWKMGLLNLGFANRVLLLDSAQGVALKRACLVSSMRFIDNT